MRFIIRAAAVIAIAHFLYAIVFRTHLISTQPWIQTRCELQKTRDFVSSDCNFPLRKAYLFALPNLKYGESLNWVAPTAIPKSPDLCKGLKKDDFWGEARRLPDIGWDAFSVWYQRAVALFRFSKEADWPGLFRAVND